jgi:transglutaminase-like putative cysteine protease
MWNPESVTQRRWALIASFGFLLAIFTAAYFFWFKQPGYPARKTFQYSFKIQNTGNELLKDVEFSVYSPVKRTANQILLSLKVSHPYELASDALNNQVLKFKFNHVAPYETRIVRIKAELGFSDISNKLPGVDADEFLLPEKYIEINEPLLIAEAERLQQDDLLHTTRKIYEWVASYLEYKDYIEEDKGALYALQSRQGDCTEYMYLFTALARINGIPSRSVGGYVYTENATFKSRDYHNWTEVFIGGRWKIVDPQKKSFFENQDHYIAMRIIAEESNALLGNSHRFAYSSSPGLVVSMQ